MNERKITKDSLEHGSLRTELSHQMHESEVSEKGRERVTAAVAAAIEHVAKKVGLQHGVGGNHLDEALRFLKTRYPERHQLKPNEHKAIEEALKRYFNIKEEPKK